MIYKNDPNTLIDKFLLISALPNVDKIISNDKFFKDAMHLLRPTGFVRATLTTVEDFWAACHPAAQ